ncbi:hypothetical protein G4B88_004618 [Cannabis sativa]|uniref:Vacuolar iron transporter n=1 Tax=Cannabis sativa TaxID=3483 RepID=A0A7J6G4V5_CANSA|nr:hypothetical protein G4B88_004618 [Cannabis sativa]
MASQTLQQICCEQPNMVPNNLKTNDPKSTQATSTNDEVEVVVERAQWLRAAVLGANDGLLSTTSLLLGVGAAKTDRWSMSLAGLAGALAGSCSMAVGEFVSVSTQRDIEEKLIVSGGGEESGVSIVLPNPHKAAAASALAFLSGSVVPLIPAALIGDHVTSVVVIVAVATLALAMFGWGGARFGGSSRPKVSAVRVVVGGWLAMAVTYGLLKPFDRHRGH